MLADMSEVEGATFKFACPNCGLHIEYLQTDAGRETDCPNCHDGIVLPASAAALAPPPLIAPPLPPPPPAPPLSAKPQPTKVVRSWKDDPATEKQLDYLKEMGYVPPGPLTKGEASRLIDQA